MPEQSVWPSELRVSADRRALSIAFDDGFAGSISAELLRVRSPSAEVQGHSPSERKTVPGKRNVMIIGVEPVGNYAVRLKFDDMHDSGIYGWTLLHRFATDQAQMMAEYEAELAAKGMSRDPKPR
ncbi:MAG: DUF971 domain-containing protein [Rhizobiales bacterium]|nr:DUF971 domain-containing protein [Hyphomicrobiales bacterium]